jgi:endonuclease YncB( thermonuclease family)
MGRVRAQVDGSGCACAGPDRWAPRCGEGAEASGNDEAPASVSAAADDSIAADPSPADLTPADPDLTVTNIVDGDTLDLSDGRRVRVLGIDSPEIGECGFEEARQFTRATLLNEEVEVAGDPTQDAVDQHGRALLYVTRWGMTTPTS